MKLIRPVHLRRRPLSMQPSVTAQPSHTVSSDFVMAKCRFMVACTCGAAIETRYIDEALEWRELHERLAPLADQLAT